MYSSYTEMCRLLPPLTSTSPSPSLEMEEDIAHVQTTPIERNQDVSSSGLGSKSGVLYRDCAEPTSSSIKGISIPASRSLSRSLSPAPVNERVGLEKALAREAEMHGNLASAREERVPSGGHSGSAYDVFMNDLDALLRF